MRRVKVVREADSKVVFECDTIREAEAFIAGVALIAKESVEDGDYGIDAPEELINPT